MEFIASDAEIKALVEKNGGPPYLTWVSSMMNTTTQTPASTKSKKTKHKKNTHKKRNKSQSDGACSPQSNVRSHAAS